MQIHTATEELEMVMAVGRSLTLPTAMEKSWVRDRPPESVTRTVIDRVGVVSKSIRAATYTTLPFSSSLPPVTSTRV